MSSQLNKNKPKNNNTTTGNNNNSRTGNNNNNPTTGNNNNNQNKSEEIRIVLEDEPLKDVVIGIDLGTTNTCAAILYKNKIEIIKNDGGEKIIPSVVCYTENKPFVGTLAIKRMYQFPESTVFESKSLLGKSFKECENDINGDMGKRCHVKIIEDKKTGKPQYSIKEKKISPEEVSAEILKEIKKIAEKYNKNIKKAVITVPAFFKEKEKDATIEAAKIAGLEVIKLISEPIAIAIAYGNLFKSKSNKERTILIFDLGAGSLGISIVKINGNEYSVLGSDGEDNLGGENFSQKLMDYFIQEIKKKYPKVNLGQGLLFDIKNEIENIKTTLSIEEKATFKVGPINGNNIFEKEINIEKYIELCEDLCKRCIKRIEKFLNDFSLKKEDINDIILVGGATRTPIIKKNIEEYFKKELKNIRGDEFVAYGAAIAGNFIKNLKDLKI